MLNGWLQLLDWKELTVLPLLPSPEFSNELATTHLSCSAVASCPPEPLLRQLAPVFSPLHLINKNHPIPLHASASPISNFRLPIPRFFFLVSYFPPRPLFASRDPNSRTINHNNIMS